MTEREWFMFQDMFIHGSNSCLETENLQRYFLKLLSDEQRQKFEAHLAGCETCVEALAQLSESDLAVERTVLDARQTDRIFQMNREKLKKLFRHKYGSGSIPLTSKSYQVPFLMSITLLFAVAVLIYGAYRNISMNQKVAQLESQLERMREAERTSPPLPARIFPKTLEPTLSQSKLYAVDTHRGAEEDNNIAISFDKDHQKFTLLFSVPREDFNRYEVEIAQGETQVWKGSLPASGGDEPQLISVMLGQDLFPTGKYFLQITGLSVSRQIAFPKYELEISNR